MFEIYMCILSSTPTRKEKFLMIWLNQNNCLLLKLKNSLKHLNKKNPNVHKANLLFLLIVLFYFFFPPYLFAHFNFPFCGFLWDSESFPTVNLPIEQAEPKRCGIPQHITAQHSTARHHTGQDRTAQNVSLHKI